MKFLSLLGHWLILVTKLVLRELETGKAKNYSVLKSFFQQWIKKNLQNMKKLTCSDIIFTTTLIFKSILRFIN